MARDVRQVRPQRRVRPGEGQHCGRLPQSMDPAGKAWMDISSHGDAEETEEAKRNIEMEKAMEQEGVKCFVVMANRTELAKFRGARVQAIREETLEQWMVAPVELVRSVLTED